MQQPVKPMLINGKKARFSSSSARKVVEFHEMEIEDTMKRNEGIGHAILGDDPLVESEQNGKKLFVLNDKHMIGDTWGKSGGENPSSSHHFHS